MSRSISSPASVQAWKIVRTMLNSSGWSALATTAIILRSRSAAVSSGATRGLDLLEPLLGVEELAAVGNVVPQVYGSSGPSSCSRMLGPVRPEAAAVEPDVEQPVVFVVGFFGGGVEQELAVGSSRSRSNLGFERPDLIEPQRGHAIEH